MRELVVVWVDALGILLIVLALWVMGYRRSTTGVVIGTVGVILISALAVMRGLPSPTRQEMATNTARLEREKVKLESDLKRTEGELTSAEQRHQQELGAIRVGFETKLFERQLAAFVEPSIRRSYIMTEYKEDELVEGLKGRYFSVKLRNARGEGTFIFDKKLYRLAEHEAEVRAAYSNFASEVLSVVPQGWSKKVFVRGGADAEGFATSEVWGAEFGKVSFRRLGGNGKYGAADDPAAFDLPVTNDALPQLRAAYLRALVETSARAAGPIELLHQPPSTAPTSDQRVGEFILYLKGGD